MDSLPICWGMKMDAASRAEDAMGHSGHRLTPQRREIYEVLLSERDHPTATEVFLRAKRRLPALSLATVYNSLEALVKSGLVKQVNVEREATRYCPNLDEHNHFVCESCGKVFDIPTGSKSRRALIAEVPEGFVVRRAETTLYGLCPNCNT